VSESYEFDPWIEGYLSYLADVRRQTPLTIRDVRCTLRRVIGHMGRSRPGVALWELELQDYLRWIEMERAEDRSPRSLAKQLSHLRGLLDYAWRSGRSDRNVLDGFSLQDAGQREPPEVLTVEEALDLVQCCPTGTKEERQERAIILLLYGCGLRSGELCRLNVGDIDLNRREVFVAHGKGDRQRYVPMPEGIHADIAAYLLDRGGKRGALFRTPIKRRRITNRDVNRIVKGAATRAGLVRHVTAKTLRHSYATHLMDRGVDLAVIAALMGHRSAAETGVYLHVLPQRPKEAVNRLRVDGSSRKEEQ
jgi:site-specific recombinase XerD